ncbi:MAG: leucine-rich repeat domain-containing protein, partial [Bacteroidales bacterium]|nr:leucine-rich repeat domain-containing protein [Bacteroidales bacterium]
MKTRILLLTTVFLLCSIILQGQTTAIPDANFEQALIDLGIDSDGTINQSVATSNISGLTALNVYNKNITDLTGIEGFISLTNLLCYNNQLTSLDLSQNTALIRLYCQNNQLTSLDVSQNIALIQLYCNNNQLASLDVTQNTALTFLICHSNQLTCLDMRNGNNSL